MARFVCGLHTLDSDWDTIDAHACCRSRGAFNRDGHTHELFGGLERRMGEAEDESLGCASVRVSGRRLADKRSPECRGRILARLCFHGDLYIPALRRRQTKLYLPSETFRLCVFCAIVDDCVMHIERDAGRVVRH